MRAAASPLFLLAAQTRNHHSQGLLGWCRKPHNASHGASTSMTLSNKRLSEDSCFCLVGSVFVRFGAAWPRKLLKRFGIAAVTTVFEVPRPDYGPRVRYGSIIVLIVSHTPSFTTYCLCLDRSLAPVTLYLAGTQSLDYMTQCTRI